MAFAPSWRKESHYFYKPTLLSTDRSKKVRWQFNDAGKGFRLLSKTEWEKMCRCETETGFSFGSDRELLNRYAWYNENADRSIRTVAGLRPNLRGMFDTHGNLSECCFTSQVFSQSSWSGFAFCGGSWGSQTEDCRSSSYTNVSATTNCGFRLCRLASEFAE